MRFSGLPRARGWRADVGIGPHEAGPSNPGGNRDLVPGGDGAPLGGLLCAFQHHALEAGLAG